MPIKDPQFPQPEQIKPIETPEDFQSWVLEEANSSDDYVEFYKKAVHKFLDLWLEDKKVGGLEIQILIRGEALKIASRENAPLNEFADKLYKSSLKYRDLRLRAIENNEISYEDSPDLFKKEERTELKEILETYKEKTGDYKATSLLFDLNKKLEPFGYANGEFVDKMRNLDKRGFPMDNVINYGGTFLSNTESAENDLKSKLTKEYMENGMNYSDIKTKVKQMFE